MAQSLCPVKARCVPEPILDSYVFDKAKEKYRRPGLALNLDQNIGIVFTQTSAGVDKNYPSSTLLIGMIVYFSRKEARVNPRKTMVRVI